jgi:hypothetical protein
MASAQTFEPDVSIHPDGSARSIQFEKVLPRPNPVMQFDIVNHAPQTLRRLSAVTCVHPEDSGGSGRSDRANTASEYPGRVQPAFARRLPAVMTNAATDNEPEAFPSTSAGTRHNVGGNASHTGASFGACELVARGAASHSEFVNRPVAFVGG